MVIIISVISFCIFLKTLARAPTNDSFTRPAANSLCKVQMNRIDHPLLDEPHRLEKALLRERDCQVRVGHREVGRLLHVFHLEAVDGRGVSHPVHHLHTGQRVRAGESKCDHHWDNVPDPGDSIQAMMQNQCLDQ